MLRAFFALAALTSVAANAEEAFFREFLLGQYRLIGKAMDSGKTYRGRVEIESRNDSIIVTRTIGGETVVGTAAIEPAVHGEAKVLRIRFRENGIAYEQTCLWHSDLDNHARISCHLYRPDMKTDDPGLEALFSDRPGK